MTKDEKDKVAGLAYMKYRNGDSLTDDEVKVGAEVFEQASQTLFALGPVFSLPAMELNTLASSFARFHEFRNLKGITWTTV